MRGKALGVGVTFLMVVAVSLAIPVASAPQLVTVTHFTHVAPTADPGDCNMTSDSYKLIRGGIKWQAFPVDYHVDASKAGIDATEADAAVDRAFATWDAEDHGGDADGNFFNEVSNANSAEITVTWALMDGPGGTLASAGISFNPATKAINSVEITFDSGDSWAVFANIECGVQSSDPDTADFDIEDVAAHEIGHAVGFDHVGGGDDTYNTLYTYVLWEGETHKRTLGQGEKLGMEDLYGTDGGGDDDNGGGGPPACHPVFGC